MQRSSPWGHIYFIPSLNHVKSIILYIYISNHELSIQSAYNFVQMYILDIFLRWAT